MASDGTVNWQYPRSNSPERAVAFRWLGRTLNDDRYLQLGCEYARRLMADPVRGIYQNEDQRVRGGVWYWRDVGLYMTNYTMRVPPAFLHLSEQTGDETFREMAILSGQFMLNMMGPVGIPEAGCVAEDKAAAPLDAADLERWLPANRINSRVGYATWTFAALANATGDGAYAEACDRLLRALARLQHDDGGFGQDWRTDRLEELDPTIKQHFLAYMIYGLARTCQCMPDSEPARTVTGKLSAFLMDRARRCGGLCYGDWFDDPPAGPEGLWRATTPDATPGLAVAARVLNDPSLLDMAKRIAAQHLSRSLDCPDRPDLHGAVPIYLRRDVTRPYCGGHFHFWLILGLMEIEASERALRR